AGRELVLSRSLAPRAVLVSEAR
ncbi:hypothetical protein MIAR_15860, partial [Microbacterium arabinogalactanolyticum]